MGEQLWNEMNILAGLSPLLFRGEQDSYFKLDFLLCSPFETAAAAAFCVTLQDAVRSNLLPGDYLPLFQFWQIEVRFNNTKYTDGHKSVAFLFKKENNSK